MNRILAPLAFLAGVAVGSAVTVGYAMYTTLDSFEVEEVSWEELVPDDDIDEWLERFS